MPHKDPDARAEYQRLYREKHRQEAAKRTAEWRENNPGRNTENSRRWREQNPEAAALKGKLYRERNRGRVNETQRAWREKSGYYDSEKRKRQSLKDWLKTYGLTPELYDTLLASQGGKCAICGAATPRMKNAKRLYIDHRHDTGAVRGLLCFPCNRLLGDCGDSIEILRAAIHYLEMASDRGAVRGEKRRLLESR